MTQTEMAKLIAEKHHSINDKKLALEGMLDNIELVYGRNSDDYKKAVSIIEDTTKLQNGLRLAVEALGIQMSKYDKALAR